MSAIAGIVCKKMGQLSACDVEQMQGRLQVHGADSSGRWLSRNCGLSANLRRTTAEDAFDTQPLQLGQFTIVADIRLNARDALIETLALKSDHEPSTLPDSRIALEAFRKWGSDCVNHLLGAFAFAIWDEAKQSLFLARDQQGEKTLFYHHCAQAFAFATMPKGLFALPWINRELNEEKLAEFLTLNHSNHGTTFFKNVHRLPPGHCLTLRNETLTLRKYWELDLTKRILLKSDEEYVEQGRELLETCIRDSLRSAAPVGAMMSGGLDSSTVACMASRQLEAMGMRFPTFTEVPHLGPIPDTDKHYGDETPFIKAIQSLNPSLDPHFVPGLQKGLFEGADERIAILEAPHRNPFNQLWLEEICHTARKQGIGVLLTGQSGNMSLSYDGLWQFPSLFKSLQWITLARELNALAKRSKKSTSSLLKGKLLVPIIPNGLWQLRQKVKQSPPYWQAFSPINKTFAERMNVRAADPLRPIRNSRSARSAWHRSVDFIGEHYQHLCSTTGVELRDPLGDIRFVQWTLSIPENQFLAEGNTRMLAKRIAHGLLPTSVLNNPNRGLQAADWAYHLNGEIGTLKKEIETAQGSETCREFLALADLENLISRWPGPRQASAMNYKFKLCRGLTVARFLRSFE